MLNNCQKKSKKNAKKFKKINIEMLNNCQKKVKKMQKSSKKNCKKVCVIVSYCYSISITEYTSIKKL